MATEPDTRSPQGRELLGWLILFVIWLWQLAAMVIAVRQVLDYSTTGKAIIVVVIGWVVSWLVALLLGGIFFGSAMMMRAVS